MSKKQALLHLCSRARESSLKIVKGFPLKNGSKIENVFESDGFLMPCNQLFCAKLILPFGHVIIQVKEKAVHCLQLIL